MDSETLALIREYRIAQVELVHWAKMTARGGGYARNGSLFLDGAVKGFEIARSTLLRHAVLGKIDLEEVAAVLRQDMDMLPDIRDAHTRALDQLERES